MLRLLLVTVAVLFFGTVRAQSLCDTLNIRFPMDSIRVDMDYADNARAWETFESHLRRNYAGVSPCALRLDIYSGASPDGTAAHNRWLGENRGIAIRRLVRERLGDGVGSIIVHNEAARWDGLYEAVAASEEPWRDEVLRIIALPPSVDVNLRDHRELKLRQLRGGTVWPVLMEKYCAPLRSGATAVLSWTPGRDTVIVRDTIVMTAPVVYPRYPQDLVFADAAGDLYRVPDSTRVHKPVQRWPAWVVRTNILMLATATPNLQVEWSLGHKDKWSLNLEGVCSWWTFAYNGYANEILYGSVELRRWLGRRYRHHTLAGWHIGLGVGGGYGDVEWRSKGYQGEVYSGFLNIGWQGRSGRRKQWAFDIGIGLGYAYVPWRRYEGSTLFPVGREEEHDNHLMWQETSRTNWIGTPHANISIGYVFGQHDARWRRERAMERDAARNDYLHFRDSLIAREQYVRDSTKTAERMRLKEIDLLPKAERKQALKDLAAEKRQAKLDAKAARKQAKIDAKAQKKQEKIDKREYQKQVKADKAVHREQRKAEKAYARTPEGKAAKRQAIIDEKAAKKQAKIDAKARKKQAKIDKKVERVRKRIEFEHRRNLEKLQREIEKADEKYRRSAK